MMRVVAADEPADGVTCSQGIAGAAYSGSAPLGIVSLTITGPGGAVGIHPAGHIAEGELTDTVQSRHISAAFGGPRKYSCT